MRIGAIDPGQEGWLAVLVGPGLHQLEPLPFTQRKKGQKPHLLLDKLRAQLQRARLERLYLEVAGSRPGEGTVSAFTSGKNWGLLYGVAWALDIEIVEVRPAVWRKALCGHMGKASDTKERKQQSIARAMELYPHAPLIPEGCRVAQNGAADALLIAHFGRTHGGR